MAVSGATARPHVWAARASRCYFGSAHLQRDVPALTGHYLAGDLLLDELITCRIGLDELNDAFDALRGGKGARSVLVLD